MSAKFQPFQDIKKAKVLQMDRWKERRTDGWMDNLETVYFPQTQFAGGIIFFSVFIKTFAVGPH